MGTKKWVATAFILLLFLGSYSQTNAQKVSNPLFDIIHVMQSQNIHVKQWGFYTKRTGRLLETEKGYKQWVEKIKSGLPAFRWTPVAKDKEGNLKITGVRFDRKTKVHERFTVLAYPRNKQWGTYEVYEIGGDHWDKNNWRKFSPTFYNRIHKYFPGNPTIFTCVDGRLNAKINLVLYDRAQQLIQAFGGRVVEDFQEKTFVSLSAYTDQWKQSIQTKNHPMNLQVALRTTDGSTARVTIGTPIITTEY
jgi:hypothetical protein